MSGNPNKYGSCSLSPIGASSKQRFELTGHPPVVGQVLGTVRALVSGQKTEGQATILSLADYYPFGMDMPGRTFTGESYRFGYQGSERDQELMGGQAYTTFFRALDPRLGRWMSLANSVIMSHGQIPK